MYFEERSYKSESSRPRPEVLFNAQGELLIMATPWGPRAAAKKAIDFAQDFILSARENNEATSPFARLTCLSPLANQVRLAVKMINDALYQEDNKNEYTSGLELSVFVKMKNEIVYVQVGQPHMLVISSQQGRPHKYFTLGRSSDLSAEFNSHSVFAPLPSHLLGLDSTSDFQVHSLKHNEKNQYLFLAHPQPDLQFLLSGPQERIEGYIQQLSRLQPEHPFWMGIIHT